MHIYKVFSSFLGLILRNIIYGGKKIIKNLIELPLPLILIFFRIQSLLINKTIETRQYLIKI